MDLPTLKFYGVNFLQSLFFFFLFVFYYKMSGSDDLNAKFA